MSARLEDYSTIKDSPVWGAENIAKIVGLSTRATFHLLEGGRLPARKVGGRWVALPSTLRHYLAGERVEAAE